MSMKLFNAEVVTSADKSGNALHTVPKRGISGKEIDLLRHVHGHEHVRKIVDAGEVERDEREEMYRLARAYGDGGVYGGVGPLLVKKVFNVDLHDFENWLIETMQREDEERELSQQQRQERFNADMLKNPPKPTTPLPSTVQAEPEKSGSFEVAKAALSKGKQQAAAATME